jgi:hypothetical protein
LFVVGELACANLLACETTEGCMAAALATLMQAGQEPSFEQ